MKILPKVITLSVLGAVSLLSVSCDTTSGALAGGGTGALVGGIVGHQSGHTAGGALIGGALGAAAGGVMGNQNQRINNIEQQNAQQRAYDQGRYDSNYR
jgi:uncharacterized protein YcfJ